MHTTLRLKPACRKSSIHHKIVFYRGSTEGYNRSTKAPTDSKKDASMNKALSKG